MLKLAHPALARLNGAPQPGRAAAGYAAGGVADRTSAAWANACLGNELFAPVVELSLGAAEATITDTGYIAWAGAPQQVIIDGENLPPRTPRLVQANSILRVVPGLWGSRVALATPGGFHGDVAHGLHASGAAPRPVSLPERRELLGWLPRRGHLRLTSAPETPTEWQPSGLYRLSNDVSPHGVRLLGPVPDLPRYDIASGPVIDGTIQATAAGLIILLRERQTVGGYPRLGQLVPADVDIAAQLRPGDAVRLDVVELSEARAITAAWHQSFTQLAAAVRD